jgi:hypothetical protein
MQRLKNNKILYRKIHVNSLTVVAYGSERITSLSVCTFSEEMSWEIVGMRENRINMIPHYVFYANDQLHSARRWKLNLTDYGQNSIEGLCDDGEES